ncbi:hypothetical protein [Leptolyngbya sp. BC1307]|uniref:hypothetical protein n=1 Tax=Leptolyngbya sp. BC1307 TaxID=2029589 RepID=UPI000EFA3EEE|nr:hypothetical protein [Leptolyngbya sp. BC1307]
MQFSHLFRKQKLPRIDSSDILPLAFAGLSTGILFLSIAFFWLAVSLSKVANQKPPTLVQQVDGKAFTVRPADYTYREPEVIRRVVSDWATMTFTWGTLPGNQTKTTDEGVEVGSGKRVPSPAWAASFLLAPDFRDEFLNQLSTEVIPEGVFGGEVSAVLVPQQVSPPQAVGEGKWKVDLMATRIVFDPSNPAGTTIPFNRRIYLRAVEPPQNPLTEQATKEQQVVYQSLEGGLQIEEIRPIQLEE